MNILIIDDNKADHDLTVDLLSETGDAYEFYHAYNAEDGLKCYQKKHIDCVLLDYHMPDKDGIEFLKQLSNSGKTAPVIMMTGDGNEYVAVTAMKLGSQDYIPKRTLTSTALKRAVERAIERTEMIARMERYKLELERSNHDLEQFAHIVAHDLKSPLRAVTQHLALIEKNNKHLLDDKSRRSIEFAVEGAVRMRNLIDALFDYAQIGFSEPQIEEVNIELLLEQTKRDLSVIIEESGAVITNNPLPKLQGDPILLTQLLQNFICNAIKYCKEKPKIHLSAESSDGMWCIKIRDNGIGIHSSQHKKIFSIFRRLHLDDEYPGIGLGLAICDRIVKQHGGEIGVESEPDKGSVFYFTLPQTIQKISCEKKVVYG